MGYSEFRAGTPPNTYQAPGCQAAHVSRAPGVMGSRERWSNALPLTAPRVSIGSERLTPARSGSRRERLRTLRGARLASVAAAPPSEAVWAPLAGASPADASKGVDFSRDGFAALFYSLIESAKLAGVEPRAYLGEAARRAIRNPGTVTLPRDFK